MAKRFLQSSGVAVLLVVVALLFRLGVSPDVGQAQSQTPAAAEKAGPAAKTPWGAPDLQGIWTNTHEVPLQRPAKYANKEFFTDEERAELDKQRTAMVSQDVGATSGAASRTSAAPTTTNIFLSDKPTGRRTSLIIDPPDGRIPPLTPEAQKRRQAFASSSSRCCRRPSLQEQAARLRGWQVRAARRRGAPRRRRYYLATGAPGRAINRSDGPEDRTLGERCMAASLPDFGGAAGFFPQIVQSPDAVSIFYDTGQGQGWQRVIPITDRPASAVDRPPVVGRLARPLGRQHAGRRRHELHRRRPTFRARARTCIWSSA